MRAVILVGGEGVRLRPLTLDLPKPLIPVVGRPLIVRLLDWLASSGAVERVWLASGYRAETFDGLRDLPLPVVVRAEPAPSGTAGAVADLGLDGPLLVLNGDGWIPLDVPALIRAHRASGAEATLALVRVPDASASGWVETDASGRVTAFREKTGVHEPGWVNGGVYVLEPEALARIPHHRPCSFERDVFPGLDRLHAWRHEGYFRDLGTPAGYLQAVADMLAGRAGVPARPSDCFTGPGTEVHPTARLVGPCALESGCRVEPEAIIEGSVLWEGCLVGRGARIRGSVLARGVTVEPGAEIPPGSVVAAGSRVLRQG